MHATTYMQMYVSMHYITYWVCICICMYIVYMYLKFVNYKLHVH